MSGDFQRVPFVQSIQQAAERKAEAAITLLGKALPASVVSIAGSIVTVKFELTGIPFTLPQVTIPVAGSQYIRLPLQAGCKGVVFPADTRIGVVTGLGASNADLTLPANLSSLVFFPVGNSGFSAPIDPGWLQIYGETGVIIESTINQEWYIKITTSGPVISDKAGNISIAWNGSSWNINGPVTFEDTIAALNGMQLAGNITSVGGGTYAGDIKTTGDIITGFGTGDQVTLRTHSHTSNSAGNPTSGPIAGT